MELTAAVKELRDRTGMGYGMCATAWKKSEGNLEAAIDLLKVMGASRADKLQDRSTNAGFTGLYRHHDGRTVSVVQLLCETDFVSNTAEFRNLADDLAMLAASMPAVCNTVSLDDLLAAEMLTGPTITVEAAMKDLSAKCGERVAIALVYRHTL